MCALVTSSFTVSSKEEDPTGDPVWDSEVQLERLHCQPQGEKRKKQKQKTWELHLTWWPLEVAVEPRAGVNWGGPSTLSPQDGRN